MSTGSDLGHPGASQRILEKCLPESSRNSAAHVAVGLYARCGKRAFDLVVAFAALLFLSPLFLICVVLIRLDSNGPAFFPQRRVGLGGKPFRIAKFRTMVMRDEREGPAITAAGDPRVTRVGRWLRRFKIDELPQLWNVLKGEMSLVGPRPELPQFVEAYTPQQLGVLSVRPGITDPASIAYRDEERLLAGRPDHETIYRETVLPQKLTLSREYIQRMSFRGDLGLILATLQAVVRPTPPGAQRSQ